MINYKVKKKCNTHGWVICNQISNGFTKQTHAFRVIIPSLCLCFSDGVVGENVYDGKQPFVINLKNEYKSILLEPPSEVSLTYLYLAFFLDGLF